MRSVECPVSHSRDLVAIIRDLTARSGGHVSSSDLAAALDYTPQHTRRLLQPYLDDRRLVRVGLGPSARIVVPDAEQVRRVEDVVQTVMQTLANAGLSWEQLRAVVDGGGR